MRKARLLTRAAFAFLVFGAALTDGTAGINWIAIWIEPYPLVLNAGASEPYRVVGLNGGEVTADLTGSPWLHVVSRNAAIVQVDDAAARLIAKAPGHAEVEMSFSGITSVVTVTVTAPKPGGATPH